MTDSSRYFQVAVAAFLSLVLEASNFETPKFREFLKQHCATCHKDGQSVHFPDKYWDWSSFETDLKAEKPQAVWWLRRLYSESVHGQMILLAGLDKSCGQGKAFRDFLEEQYKIYARRPERQTLGSADVEWIVDPKRKDEYVTAMKNARISDPEFRASFMAFDVMWDHIAAPVWSWAPHAGDSDRRGQRPVSREPAPLPLPYLFEFFGNAWHWKEPFFEGFAVDRHTQGLQSFRLVTFPRDKSGNLIKGIYGEERIIYSPSKTSSSGYAVGVVVEEDLPSIWASFPDGTRVFEVLYTTQLGEPLAVDILTREKRVLGEGKQARWFVQAVRQDSSRTAVRDWVKGASVTRADADKILAALEQDISDPLLSNLGSDGKATPFVVDGVATQSIPARKSVLEGVSTDTLVRFYKEAPMESALGSSGWQLEPRQAFSGSRRGIAIRSDTCVNCHNLAGESFENIMILAEAKTTDVSAYGNAGGYDSVHAPPHFTVDDLDLYGKKEISRMRPAWGKFFERYQKDHHSALVYRRSERRKAMHEDILRSLE